MTADLQAVVERLEALLAKATGTGQFAISGLERPLPWDVWTSNSFRRVKTDDGRDVLSGYRCSDGVVDLSMPEDRLIALVEAINALPTLLAALRQPVEGINPAHRYLIKRNSDRRFVGSTDDLGYTLPAGHRLIDTIGEDGLGAGIPMYLLRCRKKPANVRDTGRGG